MAIVNRLVGRRGEADRRRGRDDHDAGASSELAERAHGRGKANAVPRLDRATHELRVKSADRGRAGESVRSWDERVRRRHAGRGGRSASLKTSGPPSRARLRRKPDATFGHLAAVAVARDPGRTWILDRRRCRPSCRAASGGTSRDRSPARKTCSTVKRRLISDLPGWYGSQSVVDSDLRAVAPVPLDGGAVEVLVSRWRRR